MAITSEVYSRHATIDIHLETGADSVTSSKCLYKDLSCLVIVSWNDWSICQGLEKYWFFETSFSAFLHNNPVDDCADKSKIGYQQEILNCYFICLEILCNGTSSG